MGDIATLCRDYVLAPNYVDMTSRQFALLAIICDEPGPHRVRHIAKALGVQRPVITRAVDRFVELGFAARYRDAGDRRDIAIRATDSGRKFRAALPKNPTPEPKP